MSPPKKDCSPAPMTYLRSDTEIRPEAINSRNTELLAGTLGLVVTKMTRSGAEGYIDIAKKHMAPNAHLHAGTVVSMADSLCGMACMATLDETAKGFTTIELKSNFFSTAREGRIVGASVPIHLGRSTQVWDCEIIHEGSGKRMALFRCTQMVLR